MFSPGRRQALGAEMKADVGWCVKREFQLPTWTIWVGHFSFPGGDLKEILTTLEFSFLKSLSAPVPFQRNKKV